MCSRQASKLLEDLNAAQQKAVQIIDGPVLVLAGPGSGKTRVLTHRVAYLIREAGIDPGHILAVTFTNKAAREMKERLHALIGADHAADLTIGTFHKVCARFLRRDVIHLGRERDFVIYDSDDQERLMRRVLKDLNLNEKQYPPRAIHSAISSAKNELVSAAEYARLNRASYYDEIVARCYERYQALLHESNAFDFDDLLFETVRLFQQHPPVLAKYQERYRYVLVDEYQDTNRAQYVLIKQLAAQRRNLFVVGDNDQSIYAWRGADIRNILHFEEDYPDAQVILLEQNYRSTQSILDVAQAVINAGGQQKHVKQLWTENGVGVQVSLHEGYDQNDEAQWVVDEIAHLVLQGDYRLGDMAVMYRTNAQSRAVEEALMARGLRYQIIGGMRFYERKEIKDVLAYLRVIHNPCDNVSLARIFNVPARGIGGRTEEALYRWASELGVPVYQALQVLAGPDRTTARSVTDADGMTTDPVSPPQSPFNARTRATLLAFLEFIDSLITAREQLDLVGLVDTILERTHFRAALQHEYGPDEGEERWRNVQELREVAADYIYLQREAQLVTFLEEVALVADVDTLDEQQDVVTCITLHQAKGLEFPVVFLIGLEEGLLPHSRSMDEKDKLEEERRLFYVGATRARERLYLLYAFRRTSFGRTSVSSPSRFLASIPQELIKPAMKRPIVSVPPQSYSAAQRKVSRFARNDTSRFARNDTVVSNESERPSTVRFLPGQAVRHHMFGEGIVMSSKIVEGDEEVTVNFAKKGQKRLLANFANLERIEP